VTAYDFTARGVTFTGASRWRFVICSRHPPNRRPVVEIWHGFTSVQMRDTAQHIFDVTHDRRPGADVYLIDTEREAVLAHAHRGKVVFGRSTDNESGTV
jgi:hypothetical protein